MKLIAVALATLAATAVQAEPINTAKWCHLPGQGCYMLKRAADNSAEVRRSADALAEAMNTAKWCHLPGQGCYKLKRAADAAIEVGRSADALAEAMAAIDEQE